MAVQDEHVLTVGISFEASIPLIAEAKTEVSGNIGAEITRGGTSSKTVKRQWSVKVNIGSAKAAVVCTTEIWAGDVSVPWTGLLHLTLVEDDAVTLTYPTSGTLQRVSSSLANATCTPTHPDARRDVILLLLVH